MNALCRPNRKRIWINALPLWATGAMNVMHGKREGAKENMPNWDPHRDSAADLARGYSLHLARVFGDDPRDGHACQNCSATDGDITQIWTDDGTRPWLCDDCAQEVRRLERAADELASVPSCELRQQILDTLETTAQLVNRLRAHDMSQCAGCASLLVLPAIAETGSGHGVSGKVA
jgi:hypothetical protein